ncbi:phosphotyrosine protein phosphatase [Hanstruepera ponticola]|uniref:phosphotyrosine protein phosphatase n=1 Tax=Hanstruepera ponticola TaxID=2042995 RepID=UPI00177F1786|nr:phosphotyrosine protein phosphatase [Hanstruepera ponticola]
MPNILFVCSGNKDRSKTADDYFSAKYPDMHFDSAGTNKRVCEQLGTTYVSQAQLDWADRVLVMEEKHRKALVSVFGSGCYGKIMVLGIKDVYTYYDRDLIGVLEERVDVRSF